MADRNKRIRRTFREAEGDWRRADLHLHTPASADWLEPGVTYLQWLQKAESRGLDIVAITDHNTVEGIAQLRAEIERLAWLEANDRLRPQERRDLDEFRRLGNKLLVLPGVEFTATFGFHILAIFPPETPLRVLELLLLRLNVPVDRLTEGSTEVGATTDVLTAYRLIDEASGLVIAAHANSTHGVAMRGINFGGQTKIAYTQDVHLHTLEVTDLEVPGRRSSAKFFDGTKPEYPRQMHCLQGSDAHRLTRDPRDKNRQGIGDRVTEFLLPEVSFESIAAALKNDDFSVTRPYRMPTEQPYDHVLAARDQGETIIQSFHETMTQEGGRSSKVLADVVAFANTQGGTVYIGASAARKGAPRGIDDPQGAMMQLRRELEASITPPLACRVDVMQSQGASIVRVSVPNGGDKPYALRQTHIYVRQEGETSEAVRDEIVQLVLGTRSSAQPQPISEPVAPVIAAPAAKELTPSAAKPVTGELLPKETKPGVSAEPAAAAKAPRRRRRRGPQTPTTGPVAEGAVEPQVAPVEPEPAPEPITVASQMPVEAEAVTPEPAPVAPPTRRRRRRTGIRLDPADEAFLEAMTLSGEPEQAVDVATEVVTVEPVAADQAVLVAAEAEATESPASAETKKPAARQPRKRQPKAEKPSPVAAEPEPVKAGPEASTEEEAAPESSTASDELPNIAEAPAIGVEIVAAEERQGTIYFTIRDLRNCNAVHNVTSASARKLWSYAISQYLKHQPDPAKITWSGEYGLWQVARRAKKLRYDLVKHQPDGGLRVFYGVTADGMDGPWAQFLRDEDRGE